MENNKSNFNIIILSNSELNSRNIANKLFENKLPNKDIWFSRTDNGIFNGYIRSPGVIPKASPPAETDCLIYYIENENENIDDQIYIEIEDYIQKRAGIPLKICNIENVLLVDHVFLDSSSIEEFRKTIFERIVLFDDILRAAFKDIDSQNTGFIQEKEIVELTNKLNFVSSLNVD